MLSEDTLPIAIEIEDVWVRLGHRTIIKGLDLKVTQPSCIAVVGPNGAGKTTLLRLLCGLVKPTSGKITLFGLPLCPATIKSLRSKTAYLPQDLNMDLNTPITVEEVVEIGRLSGMKLGWHRSSSDRVAIDQAMKITGIWDQRKMPFATLSAGQKQRANLARALAQEAKIMLLDEPLTNLDPSAQQEICKAIEDIYESKQPVIILVTHLIEKLPKCCNRLIVMKDGTIVEDTMISKIGSQGKPQGFVSRSQI